MLISKNTLIFFFLFVLVIGSVFTKDYFPFMPGYYFKKLFVYILFFIISIQLINFKIPKINYNPLTITLFSLLFFTQSTTLFSAMYIEDVNLIKILISFILFTLIIFLHYYSLRNFLVILNEKFIPYFYKVMYIALGIILLINFIQLFSIYIPSLFQGVEQFIADHLVLQWYRPDPEDKRFYTISNSYVQTNHRLNGLVEETSENVAILFLAFMPLILGKISASLKLRYSLKYYAKDLIWFTLIIIVLLLSKSSSGLLFSALSIVIFLYIFLRYGSAVISLTMIFIFFLLVSVLIITNMTMLEYYWYKLFDKESISTLSRSGVTIGLFSMGIDNFFTGVGKGMVSSSLEYYIPDWAYNYEIKTWIDHKGFPALSMFFWLLSEYGISLFLLMIYIFYKTYKGLKKLKYTHVKYCIVYDSYKYFLIILFIALQSQTMIYKSLLLLPIMFFLVIGLSHKNLLKQEII